MREGSHYARLITNRSGPDLFLYLVPCLAAEPLAAANGVHFHQLGTPHCRKLAAEPTPTRSRSVVCSCWFGKTCVRAVVPSPTSLRREDSPLGPAQTIVCLDPWDRGLYLNRCCIVSLNGARLAKTRSPAQLIGPHAGNVVEREASLAGAISS